MMSVVLPANNDYLFPAKELLLLLSENQDKKAFQQVENHDNFSVQPMSLPDLTNSKIIAYKLLQKAACCNS
jgi:hypothetical protein